MTTGEFYKTVDGASAVVPTAFGRMRWDVTRQVQYAVSHTGKVAHFLIMDAHESSSTKYWAGFHSREYSTGWRGPVRQILDSSDPGGHLSSNGLTTSRTDSRSTRSFGYKQGPSSSFTYARAG